MDMSLLTELGLLKGLAGYKDAAPSGALRELCELL